MSRSSNRDDFFQTTSSLEEVRRKAEKAGNNNGNPIKLQSKLLAITADPSSKSCVYVAESAGVLRKLVLETGETVATYRGPTAPLTSICFSVDGATVFAGCWDKTIWSWDVASRKLKRQYKGHTDFVKVVIYANIGHDDLLISGSADSEVIVWNISDGNRLHVFKDHSRGIQDLSLDPMSLDIEPSHITIFSAGSDRSIHQFHFPQSPDGQSNPEPILEHETSVYKLFFDADGDLWTASADKSAKCLSRERKWNTEMTLEHPDFVRDILVHEARGWVVTACRDEEVRVWNRATGELYHTYSGHFEEVTGLLLLHNTIVSISIDSTVRQWSLDPTKLQLAKAEAEAEAEGVEQEKEVDHGQEPLLTEEEERELAELMED
ncbi:hypothetical protein AJ80_06820 [Polytolypa hystricis UAMH7299]|uniref:Uncharacterized protein n=1 Tax=Polytolypa hystricis (strain UAMH7299) TaxID=1447883 RepID=A0A2B7XT87_POLH7|nr:hypothetical protein AJ80_06820 [Polytolypa hystricis UAMH7299]